MNRWRWLLVAAVLVYACALQGWRPLYSPDEGRYTNVALNMLDSGDWLRPMLHPEVEHWAKPPLTYWSIATSVAVFGRNEFAARLPGALAFAATILLMVRLGRRFVPAQPWLAALTYATFAFPPLAANLVTTDTLLTLWVTLQVVAFEELWWAATPERARRARLLLWFAAGLAFMTKGPPGLLMSAASAAFALSAGGWRGFRRLFAWDALLVFLVVGGSWYVDVAIREPQVMRYFLIEEVVNRVTSDKMHRNAEWYGALKVYLPTVVLGTLPWLPLLLREGWRSRRGFFDRLRANEEARLLAFWLVLPLCVFVFARSRLPLYLLPLFVPLAVIVARLLAPLDLSTRARQAMLVGWCVLMVALRAAPAHVDIHLDDRALASALSAELPVPPHEVAFVDTDPRYGLRLYLNSEVERLELPSSESDSSASSASESNPTRAKALESRLTATQRQTQDIASEMLEREGCRVLLVNDYNVGRLERFLDENAIAHKRLADVRGYVVLAQRTPDCSAYAAL